MRLFLAILLCKLSRAALRILGRGGTALPGSLALKLCPDIVARLSRGVRTVMVTGTNGKDHHLPHDRADAARRED